MLWPYPDGKKDGPAWGIIGAPCICGSVMEGSPHGAIVGPAGGCDAVAAARRKSFSPSFASNSTSDLRRRWRSSSFSSSSSSPPSSLSPPHRYRRDGRRFRKRKLPVTNQTISTSTRPSPSSSLAATRTFRAKTVRTLRRTLRIPRWISRGTAVWVARRAQCRWKASSLPKKRMPIMPMSGTTR